MTDESIDHHDRVELLCYGINDAVSQTRKVFGLYAVVYTYGIFSLSRLSDTQILYDEALNLPIIGIGIPLSDFFIASPILIVGLYIHMLVYLLRSGSLMRRCVDNESLDTAWMHTWLSTVYLDSGSGIWGILQRAYVSLLLWLSLPVGLFFLSLSAARIHDPLLSPFTIAMTALALCISIAGWRKYNEKRIEDALQPSFLLIGVSAIFLLMLVHALAYQGAILKLDLSNQTLVTSQDSTLQFWGNLNGRRLQGATLKEANLERMSLRNADLSRISAEFANFKDAYLTGALLVQADLTSAKLMNADFTDANLTGASLAFSEVAGADFTSANLRSADLLGVYDLHKADVDDVDLTKARLGGTALDSVNLSRSILDEADLAGALLRNANLRFTSFVGADVKDVDFSGSDLTSADFRKAENLDPSQLCAAKTIRGVLPRSLYPKVQRVCREGN